MLADSYVRPEWFAHVDPDLLVPGTRRAAVVTQALALNADVLCLQEVEPSTFDALDAAFAPLGYVGRYAPKGRRKPDGCAAFVRSAALRGDARFEIPDESGHVAQALRLLLDGRPLLVLNTHLKWDRADAEPHVGEQQAAAIVAARSDLDPDALAWIVCGDLNGEPGGPVVRRLESAGLTYAERSEAPTCNANARAKKIDYVFGSSGLTISPRAPRPLTPTEPLPGPSDASDHLPLAVEVAWAPD